MDHFTTVSLERFFSCVKLMLPAEKIVYSPKKAFVVKECSAKNSRRFTVVGLMGFHNHNYRNSREDPACFPYFSSAQLQIRSVYRLSQNKVYNTFNET